MHACYRSRRVSPQFVSHTSAVFRLSFVTCSVTSHLHVRDAVDHDRVKDFLRCGEVEGDRTAVGMERSEVARARGRAKVVAAQPLAALASELIHELDCAGMEASEDLHHDRLARVAAADGGVVRLLDQPVLLVGRVAERDPAAELAGAGRAGRDGRDDFLLVQS